MANHEDDGSLAQELWQAINPFAYRGIVPYIGKNTAVKLKDFEQHDLNSTNSDRAPVNYVESLISDGGSIHGDTTDSDQEFKQVKPK